MEKSGYHKIICTRRRFNFICESPFVNDIIIIKKEKTLSWILCECFKLKSELWKIEENLIKVYVTALILKVYTVLYRLSLDIHEENCNTSCYSSVQLNHVKLNFAFVNFN